MTTAKALLHLEAALKLLRPKPKLKSQKDFLKAIKKIECPYACEALIIELEARKQQLNPDFKAEYVR